MGNDPQTGKPRFPHVERVLVIVGFPDVTRGLAFVRLKPWEERDVKQQEYTTKARPLAMQIPGTLAFPINPPSLGQRSIDKPVQFVLQTSRPFQELDQVSEQFLALVRAHPRLSTGLTNIEYDLKRDEPETKFNIDREKAANLGIDIDTIGRTLETMLGGRQVTRFKKDGKQYDVIVQIEGQERARPQQLSEIYVRARSGQMVPLASLVSHVERVAPRELNHFNKLRAAIISGNLNPGYALGDALADMRELAKQLPSHVGIDYAGVSREFTQSSRGLYEVFVMALLFIFLVLAAQFESFADPLIIMLTVPITMTGALLALWLTGNTLNVYSQIGLVTLVGLITKHGILIVEFANQLQEAGKPRVEAVQEAAALRLRPILMTTGAMVLGAIPLALATGAGGESRQAIGWVIVGGMTVGTLLTLFVVPTAYSYLARSNRTALHAEPPKTPAPPASAHPAE